MRVGLAIYNLLSNESSVSSIVGNKIFPETAPQGQEAPYVYKQARIKMKLWR